MDAVVVICVLGMVGASAVFAERYLNAPTDPEERRKAHITQWCAFIFFCMSCGVIAVTAVKEWNSKTNNARIDDREEKFQDRVDTHNDSSSKKLDELIATSDVSDASLRIRYPYGYYRFGKKGTEGYVTPPKNKVIDGKKVDFELGPQDFTINIDGNIARVWFPIDSFSAFQGNSGMIIDGGSIEAFVPFKKGAEREIIRGLNGITPVLTVIDDNPTNPEFAVGFRSDKPAPPKK